MRWTLLCLLATLVATCGQTGPLRLPEESDTHQEALSLPAGWHDAL